MAYLTFLKKGTRKFANYSWIIQAGGMGNYGRNVNQTAGKAGGFAGSVAGATAGNVAGRVGKLLR